MEKARLPRLVALILLGVALTGCARPLGSGAAPETVWSAFAPDTKIPGPLLATAVVAGNDAWAAGEDGGLYHFDGTSWTAVPTDVKAGLHSISPIPNQAGRVVVVGHAEAGSRVPTVSMCGLKQASPCARLTNIPAVGDLDGVWALSASEFFAVGGGGDVGAQQGVILHYLNGQWTGGKVVSPVPRVRYHNVQMLTSDEGWAVGDPAVAGGPGTIIHHTPGTGWQPVDTGVLFAGPVAGLAFTSSDEGWVVGGDATSGAVILHYRKGGTPEWTREEVNLGGGKQRLYYVNMGTNGTGFASGSGGFVLQRDKSGSWTPAFRDKRPPAAPFYGVWVDAAREAGWAVGGSFELGVSVMARMTTKRQDRATAAPSPQPQ